MDLIELGVAAVSRCGSRENFNLRLKTIRLIRLYGGEAGPGKANVSIAGR